MPKLYLYPHHHHHHHPAAQGGEIYQTVLLLPKSQYAISYTQLLSSGNLKRKIRTNSTKIFLSLTCKSQFYSYAILAASVILITDSKIMSLTISSPSASRNHWQLFMEVGWFNSCGLCMGLVRVMCGCSGHGVSIYQLIIISIPLHINISCIKYATRI